ncbi:MAG: hypothetical protein CM1200mP26_01450 [Acidimicrobiales bacterium]|nr:MAG: hypothetical protein CM1200mP26_01450 [Acidimicrobiales bacterium]
MGRVVGFKIGTARDRVSTGVAFGLVSIPNFALAVVLYYWSASASAGCPSGSTPATRFGNACTNWSFRH